jgi:hypothetical protein
VCEEAGLREHGFVLYAGNLDGYQDLDLLAEAAARLPEEMGPVIVATRDAGESERSRSKWRSLRFIEAQRFEQIRALSFAAHTLVVTRRRPRGFPVKLLNYMETGRSIIAFERVAAGLEHDESAWLLPATGGPGELADATPGPRSPARRSTWSNGSTR